VPVAAPLSGSISPRWCRAAAIDLNYGVGKFLHIAPVRHPLDYPELNFIERQMHVSIFTPSSCRVQKRSKLFLSILPTEIAPAEVSSCLEM
jgi:hypothetical protein